MPLDELTDFGYEVYRPTTPSLATLVTGNGRDFFLQPGDDEETLVRDAKNHVALADKLAQAQGYFADNYTGWPGMTANQKDAANRNAQRALSNLIRHVRNDLSSEGI